MKLNGNIPLAGPGLLAGLLLAATLLLVPALAALGAEKLPGWWAQAKTEADRDGYGLISAEDLKKSLDNGQNPLLLDVRPDYEFKADHLSGAVNLEFHLGDRTKLAPIKEKALREILGPDPDRPVVIYCRSYQ